MGPEHSWGRPRSGSCFTPAAPGQGEAAAPRLCHHGRAGGIAGSPLLHPRNSGHLEGGRELSPRPQGSVDAGAGLKVNAAPPGSSHANVPALHPAPHPLPGSVFPFSCLSPAGKTNTPEIRAILAESREQSPLSETRGCLPKPRAQQMGETALSGSPSQGHMSYFRAQKCC